MSLHQRYIGKSISFSQCPSTGKVILAVVNGDLFPDANNHYKHGYATAEQRFEFVFDQDSAELNSCLNQLAEIIQG